MGGRTRAGGRGHPQGGARQGAAAPAGQPHAGRAVRRHPARQARRSSPSRSWPTFRRRLRPVFSWLTTTWASAAPRTPSSLLTPLSADPATFAEAESRLAALDYSEGRVAEAHKRLDAVLTRMPNNAPVLVMKAQWLTTENKLDEALDRAKAAVAADPQSAAAHFALAVVHDRRREVADATKSYNEVLRLNPRAVAAQVELSRLSLTSGDGTAALRYAEGARQAEPSSLEARVALARSLMAAGNLPRAEAEIAELLKGAPNAAVVHALNGTLQATQKKCRRCEELVRAGARALARLSRGHWRAHVSGPAGEESGGGDCPARG